MRFDADVDQNHDDLLLVSGSVKVLLQLRISKHLGSFIGRRQEITVENGDVPVTADVDNFMPESSLYALKNVQ